MRTENDANRRTARSDLDNARTDWSYDAYDQLTGASRTNGPNGAFDATYRYGYRYDRIGNRLHEDRGRLDLDGTFNTLKQLTHLTYGKTQRELAAHFGYTSHSSMGKHRRRLAFLVTADASLAAKIAQLKTTVLSRNSIGTEMPC
jgi:hypothetical protein